MAGLGARRQAEALLAQEAAAGEARERVAVLAERSRLARDLHDVLAHSLSVLAVQLEAVRLTAITTAAGGYLVGQITHAHELTCIGVLNARRALAVLRDGEPTGPDSLPAWSRTPRRRRGGSWRRLRLSIAGWGHLRPKTSPLRPAHSP